jgi:hypothetical protein
MKDCILSAEHQMRTRANQPATPALDSWVEDTSTSTDRQHYISELVHPLTPTANPSLQQGNGFQHTHCDQPKHWLILPDPTAIGIRLRYASRTPVTTYRSGEPLSNTLTTYPQDGDNHGKLWLISDRRRRLEWSVVQSQLCM